MPWYRAINPKDEIRILTVRERLTDEKLLAQQYHCPNDYAAHLELQGKCTGNFTRLSAFQYLKSGTKQHIFPNNADNIGVLLLRYSDVPRDVFWRDSYRTVVSDNIFKKSLSKDAFEKALNDNSFVAMKEEQVSANVGINFKKLKKQYTEEDLDPNDVQIPWTEGLFRYKMKEIDGIVVNPKSVQNCIQGYCFAKIVEAARGTQCKFYFYDAEKTMFTSISRDTLKQIISSSKTQIKVLLREYVQCKASLEKAITM